MSAGENPVYRQRQGLIRRALQNERRHKGDSNTASLTHSLSISPANYSENTGEKKIDIKDQKTYQLSALRLFDGIGIFSAGQTIL